jgi:hypothetical protein
MKRKILLTAASLLCATCAHAARTLTYDGSAMGMNNSGDEIEIVYTEVPPMLRELGVVPGQRLLHGKWEDTILVGEAYAFAKGCAPIAYPVRGVVDRSGALIVIGPAPTDCSAREYAWGPSSVMRFDPPQQPAPAAAKQRVKPKPKPRPAQRRQPSPWPQQQQWRWW